jgi:hypothetical protein
VIERVSRDGDRFGAVLGARQRLPARPRVAGDRKR